MDSVWQDIRYAVRNLAKSPGFAVIAILTIALGMGANTAIFGAVKKVLLRPLGMRRPDQLVMLWPRNLSRNIPFDLITPGLYYDWRSQNQVFSEMAYATDQVYTLTGSGEPESLVSWRLSTNFMHVLGVEPILGRTFSPDEAEPGRNGVVVLTHQIWQRRFAGDRNILGRSITLNDTPYTVIGVMPAGFNFPSDTNDLWTPLGIPAGMLHDRTAHRLRVVARIKDGLDVKEAQQGMEQLSARLGQQYPDTDRGWDVNVQPVRDMFVGDVRAPLLAIMGAVGFVLLIACANVANLLLARASARRREIAIRVTLGASRGRIVQQLLTESMLLAVAGCVLGLVVAAWAAALLVRLFPNSIANVSIPRVEQIPIDATVVGFSFALAVLTGMLFGAAPALQVSAVSPEADLKEGNGRTIGSGGSTRKLRSALVVAQVSLALVLLICSGLMIKSFLRLQNAGLGFNPARVLTMYTTLPQTRYKTDADRIRFVQNALTRIQSLPGVQSAGAVNFLPLSGFWGTVNYSIPGAPPAPVAQWPAADYRIASQDYFKTLQIPLLRGRNFTAQDTSQTQPVCLINATLTRRVFGEQDPIGKFLIADPDLKQPPWLIVGVIGDVKHFGAAEAVHSEVYRPFTQDGFPFLAFTAKTSTEPMAVADQVRRAIWDVDKDLAITRVLSLEEAASQSSALRCVGMIIFGFFAATALALAALGIYGVVSYLVVRRTREVGIRMALGAQPREILQMMVGQSFRVAAIGLVVGIAGAFAVTRYLSSLLFQVRALDVFTFVSVTSLLGLVALLAAWLPARRAARLDPMEALHYE